MHFTYNGTVFISSTAYHRPLVVVNLRSVPQRTVPDLQRTVPDLHIYSLDTSVSIVYYFKL